MKHINQTFNQKAKAETHKKTTRPIPFSIRLSQEERAQLEQEAGKLPLGEYIRQCLFNEVVTKRRKFRKPPVKDKKLLAQLLAALGQSRLSSNLNQIAKAIHSGTLILSPEIRAMLLEACADIQAIRSLLIKALGLDG